MRKTLALLGATALAITGLAGPASASEINAETGEVRFSLVETGTSSSPSEAWFHLQSTTQQAESLQDLAVLGCVAANPDPISFVDAYGANDEALVAPGSFETADPKATTAPDPDRFWDGLASGQLVGEVFRLELVSSITGGTDAVIDFEQRNEESLNDLCLAQMPGGQTS